MACTTRLLSDEPALSDELGSHRPIALALAETIATDVGGRTIALIGPYGSGKSTVIGLVADELRETLGTDQRHSEVFVFDAWSHQGDPLRRSFLEELTRFLEKRRWITEDAFADKIGELTKRLQKSTTRSSPELTIQGSIVGASFFGVPIGAALISKNGVNAVDVAISILPFFAFLGVFVNWLFGGARRNLPWLELLWKKIDSVTESQSISTIDPTSIEFRDIFQDIVRTALRGGLG